MYFSFFCCSFQPLYAFYLTMFVSVFMLSVFLCLSLLSDFLLHLFFFSLPFTIFLVFFCCSLFLCVFLSVCCALWIVLPYNPLCFCKVGKGSISSTFYEQLLCMQIPKAQKRQSSWQSFLRFWNLCVQKLLIEHWWNWPQVAQKKQLEIVEKVSNHQKIDEGLQCNLCGMEGNTAKMYTCPEYRTVESRGLKLYFSSMPPKA